MQTIIPRFSESCHRVKWYEDKLAEEESKFQSFVERNLAVARVKGRIICAKEQRANTAAELRKYPVIEISEESDLDVLKNFELMFNEKFKGAVDFSAVGGRDPVPYCICQETSSHVFDKKLSRFLRVE